jgi:hypothetical protein
MPQIIVTADRGTAFGEGAVTLRERVNVADFKSRHFATQLVERLGWAVEDADRAEQVPAAERLSATEERRRGARDRRREASDRHDGVSELSDEPSQEEPSEHAVRPQEVLA